MKKIKDIYIEEKEGLNFLVLETEDGALYKQEDIPTGNCWMLYWVKAKRGKEIKELADLILKVNKLSTPPQSEEELDQ